MKEVVAAEGASLPADAPNLHERADREVLGGAQLAPQLAVAVAAVAERLSGPSISVQGS